MWPQCVWLCRMLQSHLPSPRLPTTWQCLRTRLLGPWWAKCQPRTWTPQPAPSGELAGAGRGLREKAQPQAIPTQGLPPTFPAHHTPLLAEVFPTAGLGARGGLEDLLTRLSTHPYVDGSGASQWP